MKSRSVNILLPPLTCENSMGTVLQAGESTDWGDKKLYKFFCIHCMLCSRAFYSKFTLL